MSDFVAVFIATTLVFVCLRGIDILEKLEELEVKIEAIHQSTSK